jgi:hypothetical protein
VLEWTGAACVTDSLGLRKVYVAEQSAKDWKRAAPRRQAARSFDAV